MLVDSYYDNKHVERKVEFNCRITTVPKTDFIIIEHPASKDKKALPSKALLRKGKYGYEFYQYITNYKFHDDVLAVQNLDGVYQFAEKKYKKAKNIHGEDISEMQWELSRPTSNHKFDRLSFASKLDFSSKDAQECTEWFVAEAHGKNMVLDRHGRAMIKTKDIIQGFDPESRMILTKTKLTNKQKLVSRTGEVLAKGDRVYACLGGFVTFNKSQNKITFTDKFNRTHEVLAADKTYKINNIDISEVSQGCVRISTGIANVYLDCAGRVSENATNSSKDLYRFLILKGDIGSISTSAYADPRFAEAIVRELQNRSSVDLSNCINSVRTMAQSAEIYGSGQLRILSNILQAVNATINLGELQANLNTVKEQRERSGKKLEPDENSRSAEKNLKIIERIIHDPEFAREQIKKWAEELHFNRMIEAGAKRGGQLVGDD